MQPLARPRYILLFISFLIFPVLSAQDNVDGFTTLHGKYLGQKPAGYKPEPFVHEIFSVWSDYGFHLKSCVVFAPDNDELIFSNQELPIDIGKSGTLWQMFRENDVWTGPAVASFSSEYSEDRAFYSASGDTLYFSSTQPVSAKGPAKDFDIWFVKRQERYPSRSQRLGYPFNTIHNDHCGTMAASGTVYFNSDRPGGNGGMDVYCVRSIDGSYGSAENLGEGVNTGADEYVVCVAGDETYMILYRAGVNAGAEKGLHISYKDKHKAWTSAKSMGDHLNVLNAVDANLSPDNSYLFVLSENDGVYWLKTGLVDYLKDEDLEVSKLLISTALKSGMEAALSAYWTLKQRHAVYMDINEYLLNQRGHHLLDAEHYADAITLFQIIVELFPDSWNAYDSLGEAYFASGESEQAVQSYERSLELNPHNENAVRMLEYIRTGLDN